MLERTVVTTPSRTDTARPDGAFKSSLTFNSRWRHATYALLALLAAIGVITLPSYGATWDDESVVRQGADFIAWYASGFQDDRVLQHPRDKFYGAFFAGTSAALQAAIGRISYEVQHAIIFCYMLAGVGIAAWLGTVLGGSRAGFFSALFLSLTPVYYGHGFTNPKDLPFAVLLLASFATLVNAWRAMPHIGRRHVVIIGTTIGLMLAIRIIGIVVFVYGMLLWSGWLVWKNWPIERVSALWSGVKPLALAGVAITGIAWAVLVLWWPFAQLNPIVNPVQALLAVSRFPWAHPVRFNGADVLSTDLPWTYAPVWFAMTLPDFYGVAMVLGVLALLGSQKRRMTTDAGVAIVRTVLCISAVLPVAAVIAGNSVMYDGIRHLLFVIPPLAVCLALACEAFFCRVESRAVKVIASLVLVAGMGLTLTDMIQLHPYQSVYFNRLVAGGLQGAAGRFETDYWGQSYKEAVEWLIQNAPPTSGRPLRVANCSDEFLTGYYLRRSPALRHRFVSVNVGDAPDFMLATTRFDCHRAYPGRVLYTVQRMGVPLCYVTDVRAARP